MICNFTNSVWNSLIQTLKLIAFFMNNTLVLMAKCLMINAKNKNKIKKTKFLTVSWLSGLLSAQVNGAGGSRCQH